MAMLSNERVYETSTERCETCVRIANFMLLKAWFLSLTEFSNDSTCWSSSQPWRNHEFLWFLTCSSALSCFVKVVIQKGRAINTFCHTRKMLRCRTASSMPFAGKCFLEWICGHSLREAVHSSFDRKKKGCVQTCRLLPKGARHLWSHIKCSCQTTFDSKSPTLGKWRLPLNDVLFVWGLHSVLMIWVLHSNSYTIISWRIQMNLSSFVQQRWQKSFWTNHYKRWVEGFATACIWVCLKIGQLIT